MVFGLYVARIQSQFIFKFLRRLIEFTRLYINQHRIIMDHRSLTIERQSLLQFFQSFRGLTLFVISLAQQDMKLWSITTEYDHLLDHLIGLSFLSLLNKRKRQRVIDADIKR